jgi:hypothetical protein
MGNATVWRDRIDNIGRVLWNMDCISVDIRRIERYLWWLSEKVI